MSAYYKYLLIYVFAPKFMILDALHFIMRVAKIWFMKDINHSQISLGYTPWLLRHRYPP